jgi:hypothetical protein
MIEATTHATDVIAVACRSALVPLYTLTNARLDVGVPRGG